MRNNLHDATVQRQVIMVLVLLNAVALRDDYLQDGSPDNYGIGFFLLAMLAICLAGYKKQPGRQG